MTAAETASRWCCEQSNHRASEEIRHALQQLVLTHPHAGIRKQAAGVPSHVMAKHYEWR